LKCSFERVCNFFRESAHAQNQQAFRWIEDIYSSEFSLKANAVTFTSEKNPWLIQRKQPQPWQLAKICTRSSTTRSISLLFMILQTLWSKWNALLLVRHSSTVLMQN